MTDIERVLEAVGEILDERFEALFAELVPAIARELVALPDRPARREPLRDAKATAAYLGVNVSWVYAHADELRVRRLGEGKATLRFSLEDVDEVLVTCPAGRTSPAAAGGTAEPKRARRRRRGSGSTVELLPVREANDG